MRGTCREATWRGGEHEEEPRSLSTLSFPTLSVCQLKWAAALGKNVDPEDDGKQRVPVRHVGGEGASGWLSRSWGHLSEELLE